MVDRVAGLDVHKRTVTVCVRTPDGWGGRREQKRTFPTYYGDLCDMRDWLAAEGVTLVVMEATGVFWKPPWMVLEDVDGVELRLVNARHVHQVPGRKTDVGDAAWLAQLAEVGLLSGSFVPDREIRDLRDLTRYRKRLVQDRTREGQRIEKVLEDAGVKLASVASRTLGKSGRAMLDALIGGERDPEALARLAKGRLKARSGDLAKAMAGQIRDHHVRMLRFHLGHIDALNVMIADLDTTIDAMIGPYAAKTEQLRTIPGIGLFVAIVILAECGLDMASFPTPAHLASWAAFCPGNNESGGKHRSGKTRHGNVWLADALTQAAWAASRTDTFLGARFRRLRSRLGAKRAITAVAHSMLIAIWHVLHDDVEFNDLGADWHDRINPEARTRSLIRQLEALGHSVTIQSVA